MLYYCYGSNLNMSQMVVRCPNAKPIKPVVLKDYTLTFKSNYRGNGVATIIPSPGSVVPGALWQITKPCLMALDRYEGYPRLYDRCDFEVIDSYGEKIKAMSYYMVGSLIVAKPSNVYYKTIKQGYLDFGLEPDLLDYFVSEATAASNLKRT